MFDAKKILEDTPERVSGPLPAGWYEATIKQFVMKTSKSSEEYLNVEMQTDQGRIWYNLNIIFRQNHSISKHIYWALIQFTLCYIQNHLPILQTSCD